MDRFRQVRPTRRGTVLGLVGITFLLAGTLLGVRVVVQVGALLLLAVLVGSMWLLHEVQAQNRGGLRLVRSVNPHPVTVGSQAVVEVDLTSRGAGQRLDRLQIAERAAHELSGARSLRARVQRSADRLTLRYTIWPDRRGRWPVGPLEVQRRDLFGLVGWRGPLGPAMLIAVRPAVTTLSMANRASSTDVDRAAVGARTPAADDSSLRDYRSGDDLRRVHWRSSARRGELVVRQDERAGRRPSTVLLDIPGDDVSAEWSISLAASIALALVASGHHVRMLGGDVLNASTDHHRPDTDGRAVDALLDHAVDLSLPANSVTREAWLLAAIDTLSAQAGGTELLFAVVGSLEPDLLTALARVSDGSSAWAMVRTGHADIDDPPNADETRTLESLRRAGWTACAVRPGEDIAECWARLLDSAQLAGVPR